MPTPQQPELRRSETIPAFTPDAVEGELAADERPDATDPRGAVPGPVPPENRPATASGPVQDKPAPPEASDG